MDCIQVLGELSTPLTTFSTEGSLGDRKVVGSASDCQCSNFESLDEMYDLRNIKKHCKKFFVSI